MKKTLLFMALVAAALTISSCKKCKGEDPIARIVNNGTESVTVHIETTGGNTVNINNILPGEKSEDKSFGQGLVDFTVSIGNMSPEVVTVTMEQCWEYEIVIDANNNITSVPKDRND